MRQASLVTAGSQAPPPAKPAGEMPTEYPFVLPRGYVDEDGVVHRDGVMRLATARDEIAPQSDPRVRENPAFLTVLLLASTVTRLGSARSVDTYVIESLFASDLAFLQDLYRRINQAGHTEADVVCPNCEHAFCVDVAGEAPGES
ncbi:phage tail assembly protein [Amycolatopsis sp. H20-H5]|uniref:phage tail assembly protein n=1 Tax=Amycolatopsis sp. H20-H5 TaxID=3046309 RepID=UPI002DBD110B|nr:phage tail assembly protein [Amycolatopsis sp. H20-H5]MEC3978758.1 phage tail assembly protein [Amycolatopsis sp. H20-H5]